MLEKKKKSKTKILCMLFLVTAIFAGSVTAYARTVTDKGKTLRGWTYKFVGSHDYATGITAGSTKASFTPHTGCYAELQIYVLNKKTYWHRKVSNVSSIEWAGNVGMKVNNLRIYHRVYSKKGACTSGGHTIY